MPENAVTRSIVVTDPSGLHLRSAMAIAELVRRCKSRVTLSKDQQTVAGDEMLGIATMAAEQGSTVTIEAVGPDATEVVDAIEPMLAGIFGD
jgi:phosphocarrier protein HPr